MLTECASVSVSRTDAVDAPGAGDASAGDESGGARVRRGGHDKADPACNSDKYSVAYSAQELSIFH